LKPTRLFFLDAVRAFAILMMLQGHFIDTLLDPIYRDKTNLIYSIWQYFRGITAPTFFTITGLVFTYLLLKAKEKGCDKKRVKKGLQRGLLLIFIGYLLRFSFISFMFGRINMYFLVVDVLQCIGISIILVVIFYFITLKKNWLLGSLFLIIGSLIFISEPLYRNLEASNLPVLFANYLTTKNGSIFTLIPWFGFVCFGGFIAVLFHKHGHKSTYKQIKITFFFIIGLILIKYSTYLLNYLGYHLKIQLLRDCANYNYLLPRFGNVLILFGVFYTFERFLKQAIITKIGQKTLSIYVIHFIIIYGSFTGIGLKRFFSKSLEPIEAIVGAVVFMIVVCLISFYYVKTNTFVYNKLREFYERLKHK